MYGTPFVPLFLLHHVPHELVFLIERIDFLNTVNRFFNII